VRGKRPLGERNQLLKKFLELVGLRSAVTNNSAAAPPYEPYGKANPANEIYDLLFCDNPSAFQPKPGRNPTDWQLLLFGASQDPARIAELAQDPSAESRVRALASNWLRTHGHEPAKKSLFGVIIEVPLDHGLDVLAAYADSGVRYINQTGKMAFIEAGGLPEVNQPATRLIELAQPVVARIGPWDKARLPPPVAPKIRLTFIVSDGLYFGEGHFEAMQQDALAAPLIQQGASMVTLLADKVQQGPRSA
jgi:hypothetical protein